MDMEIREGKVFVSIYHDISYNITNLPSVIAEIWVGSIPTHDWHGTFKRSARNKRR